MQPGEMTAAILAITLPVFLAGAGLMAWAGRTMEPAQRRRFWLKYAVYVLAVHAILGTIITGWFSAAAVLIVAAGAIELALALARIPDWSRRCAIAMAYFALAAGLLFAAVSLPRTLLLFLYLVVAGFDGFSEIFGRLLGRFKLARNISPGKTVEGALAGGAGAIILAAAAGHLAGKVLPVSALLGAGIAVAALSGDLAASWVKRRAGIKDYSGIIPGHGGVLDRFDSFIGAGALAGAAVILGL